MTEAQSDINGSGAATKKPGAAQNQPGAAQNQPGSCQGQPNKKKQSTGKNRPGVDRPQPTTGKNQFGTFGGVFTPSILTIFGVIMFMRGNYVTGQAGVRNALLILLLAKMITFLTALSLSAIATNMRVKGGGAYFIISRVLGPEFGGSIGIALYWALALSGPFYILGFTEALVRSFPALEPYFMIISFFSAALLYLLAYVGADWAIRFQYVIMAILFSAIAAFLGGAWLLFDAETLAANWEPATAVMSGDIALPFWAIFAIFFPAVTGMEAGINMSGDLKDPTRSIPLGALSAVLFGGLVYGIQIVLCGGAFAREAMIELPYQTLRDNALFGLSPLVAAGVFAATLSSALGSFMGAPRVLQAVARDNILDFLKPFARGSAKGDEPRRAIILTAVVGLIVFLWAGNQAEGTSLNIVAGVITMFFLLTYGMVNMAAFTEAFGGNPSFRPRFRFFHWVTALTGMLVCVGTALLVDPLAAVVATIVLASLLSYIRKRKLQVAFGDARRGFVYSKVRENLLKLAQMPEDDRNWRPTILLFSGNPEMRKELTHLAIWLESGRGIVFMGNVLVGDPAGMSGLRNSAIKQITMFCQDNNLNAFPVVTVAPDFATGFAQMLQIVSMGPIQPNIVMFGWSGSVQGMRQLNRSIDISIGCGKSVLVVVSADKKAVSVSRRIDIWWRGMDNGALMILLAYLLRSSLQWSGFHIRMLRMVPRVEGKKPAEKALVELLEQVRVEAEVEVIVSEGSFKDVLYRHSQDASMLFIGLGKIEDDKVEEWYHHADALLADMPVTVMVRSCREIAL